MSEYYAVIRSTDHLAHYGVKGMRWGVRKAIAYGNEKSLDRHFRKAAKKLKKLQDIGLNSGKYAAKAAAYGAAAAGTASIAIGGGSKGITKLLRKRSIRYDALTNSAIQGKVKVNSDTINSWRKKSANIGKMRENIEKWGNSDAVKPFDVIVRDPKGGYQSKTIKITKNQVLRAGTGLAALGLAAKAGQNAYRASHGAKYRDKAVNFKNEMDNAFKGTKYEGQYSVLPKKRKRR